MSIGPGGESARVALYTPVAGSGSWGASKWDQSIWAAEAWQSLDCEVTDALYRWGAGSEAGVLTKAEAGELDLTLFDPSRLLDPLNTASPLWGAIRPGTPVRLEGVVSDDGTMLWPAAYGFIDSSEHSLASGTGRIRAIDGVAVLAQAQFPGGTGAQPVPDTLRARVRDVVSRAGAAGLVPVEPESAFAGVPDPPVAPRDINADAEPAWQIIQNAAEDALWFVWVDPTGMLRFRDFAAFPGPTLGLGCSDVVAVTAHWTFDNGNAEDTGPTGAYDGTIVNAVGFTGGGVWVNGGYAEIPDAPAFDFRTDFALEAELEIFGRGTIISKGNNAWGLTTAGDGRIKLVHQFQPDGVIVSADWPGGRHRIYAALIAGVGTIDLDGVRVASNRWDRTVFDNDFPVRIGAATDPGGNPVEMIDGIIYDVLVYGPGNSPLRWLPGLADVVGRVTAESVTNRVIADDAAGEPLAPVENAASQARYGIRELAVDRSVPFPATWAAEILDDRANATYQLDVSEVRPYNRPELFDILNANTIGPQKIRIRDDEHGTPVDLEARTVGGEIGVTPDGWRARWITNLPPQANLPTRALLPTTRD